MSKKVYACDLRALGLALKQARTQQGLSREKVGAIIGIEPRYLTNIENKGQHPSLDVFYRLVSYFHISVDQFFYAEESPAKGTMRRRIENKMDDMSEHELVILDATADGIIKSRKTDQ